MRVIFCKSLTGTAGLIEENVPPPPLVDGAVRIAVHACGMNFADSLIIKGQYQVKPELPFSPGFEIAGEVIEVAKDVSSFKPGARVMGVLGWGGYAEEVVLPAENVFPIPGEMDFVTAAGFPIVYGTSHGALAWRARLQAKEVLLVHGAAGGVGLTAVEIGKAMGATVIATAGGPEKLAIARQHGADHLIDYTKEDIKERVRALTQGRGANVIYDPIGGDVFDASLRAIAPGGRILVIGFASGRIPMIPANILLVKNCDVMGFYWGHYRMQDPQRILQSFETLFDWYAAGKLKPYISQTMDLSEAPRAIELLVQRKTAGKIVLTTGRT